MLRVYLGVLGIIVTTNGDSKHPKVSISISASIRVNSRVSVSIRVNARVSVSVSVQGSQVSGIIPLILFHGSYLVV